jgi:hypothetical protein
MEGESRIPFGIGVVTDASDQSDICIQWLGNANGKTNLAFRLCWHQASTSQIYYRDHKIHNSHTPVTGSDVNANGSHSSRHLNSEGKIASRIRHILEDHPIVKQAWGDSEKSIFAVSEQSWTSDERDAHTLFTAEQRPSHHKHRQKKMEGKIPEDGNHKKKATHPLPSK